MNPGRREDVKMVQRIFTAEDVFMEPVVTEGFMLSLAGPSFLYIYMRDFLHAQILMLHFPPDTNSLCQSPTSLSVSRLPPLASLTVLMADCHLLVNNNLMIILDSDLSSVEGFCSLPYGGYQGHIWPLH